MTASTQAVSCQRSVGEKSSSLLLRWAGSKRASVQRLASYWGTGYERYIEPFAGSACLFFQVKPKCALLADINPELINALKQLKKHPTALHASLVSLDVNEDAYYAIRRVLPSTLSEFQRAVRFFYLNRYCFNGLYRTNRAGLFNVPYSGSRNGPFPPSSKFVDSASVLANARLLCVDFERTVTENVCAGDFVYLDPPYAINNRRVFRQYDPTSFGLADIQRLTGCIAEIEARGAFFVLSYADCPESRKAFSKWFRESAMIQRNIAGFAAGRRRSREMIYSNIAPSGNTND
jgi:DNA adenine methylase